MPSVRAAPIMGRRKVWHMNERMPAVRARDEQFVSTSCPRPRRATSAPNLSVRKLQLTFTYGSHTMALIDAAATL